MSGAGNALGGLLFAAGIYAWGFGPDLWRRWRERRRKQALPPFGPAFPPPPRPRPPRAPRR